MSIDMFVEPEHDPRTEPPGQGSELATAPGLELAGARPDTWRGPCRCAGC